MEKYHRLLDALEERELKDFLLFLVREVFSTLDTEEQKDLILEMIGQSEDEHVSSLVHF